MRSPQRFVACLLLLGSGSVASQTRDFVSYLNDPKALRVMVQACIPHRTAFFDDVRIDVTDLPADLPYHAQAELFTETRKNKAYASPYKSSSAVREYQQVRLWRGPVSEADFPRKFVSMTKVVIARGIGSAGGGAEYLADSSEKDQAVFSMYTHARPGDLIAVGVAIEVRRGDKLERRTFWFKPPRGLRHGAFGGWTEPVSEEDAYGGADVGMANGREMPINPVGDNAPRARFMLQSMEERAVLDEEGRRAMRAAHLQNLAAERPVAEERFHFVPAKRASIPPC